MNTQDHKKLVNFTTRISREQRQRWDAETKKHGYASLAEYVRFTIEQNIKNGIISKEDHANLTKTLSDLYFQIERIGNNLNQLTKYHHQTKTAYDLSESLSGIETLKTELETALRDARVGLHRKLGSPRPSLRKRVS